MFRNLLPALLAASAAPLLLSSAAPVPRLVDQCLNCAGGADADSSSLNPICALALVQIEVDIGDGECARQMVEPIGIECTPGNCIATVSRDWAYVNSDAELDFCIKPPGQPRMCRDTDAAEPGAQGPSSGPLGAGQEDNFENPNIQCGAGTYQFSIRAGCGGYDQDGEPRGSVQATAFADCTDNCS